MANLSDNNHNTLRFSHKKHILSFAEFEQFVDAARCLVEEVTRAVTKTSGGWVISGLRYGSATLETTPLSLNGKTKEVENLIINGLDMIEEGIGKPEFFSEKALRFTRRLGKMASSNMICVSIVDGKEVVLSGKSAKNVSDMLTPRQYYFGSIIGNLDTLSVHGRKNFTVYGENGETAKCFLGLELLDRAKDLLGLRVVASGKIAANRLGNIVSLEVDEIYEAPKKGKKHPSEYTGSIPDFTGGISIPEYLASNRMAECS